MEVALSCDHRVVYGAEAARFLQRLRELLEHPAAARRLDDGARPMAEIEFREAIRDALDEELERDEQRDLLRRGRGRRGRRLRGDARPAREVRRRSASSTRRSPSWR